MVIPGELQIRFLSFERVQLFGIFFGVAKNQWLPCHRVIKRGGNPLEMGISVSENQLLNGVFSIAMFDDAGGQKS